MILRSGKIVCAFSFCELMESACRSSSSCDLRVFHQTFHHLRREFKVATGASIASGYVSDDVLAEFQNSFYRIANDGGLSRLLVGMAFYEGLSPKKLALLEGIHKQLSHVRNGSGVYVIYTRKFHGKVYLFNNKNSSRFYIGSSNFSRSGISGNLECTALIQDSETKDELNSYLEYLFGEENAVPIIEAEITVLGSKEYQQKIALRTLSDLDKYDPKTINKETLASFEYSLSRIADKEKSNLNVYFGKGRWSRATGKVLPRPWYEVELIAQKSVNSNPIYPKGDFLAYTDDGYIIPMRTSGDYFKNIRSKKNLQILGQWIKGKLQKSSILIPLTPITPDTLDQYGHDAIKFYKMSEGKYYLEF